MKVLFLFAISIFLSGCMLINSAYSVDETEVKALQPGRAYILMGLSFNEKSKANVVRANFVKYDPVAEDVVGNCMFFNTFGTHILKSQGEGAQYFLYNVPSGYWAYDGHIGKLIEIRKSSGNPSKNNDYVIEDIPEMKSIYFEALSQEVTYVGTYAPSSDHSIDIQFDIVAAKQALKEMGLSSERLVVSKHIETRPPGIIVCSP